MPSSLSNQELTQAFYDTFSASYERLASLLEATPPPTATVLQQIASDVAQLRKDLVDASAEGFLPTYDQRQRELQLKALENSLSQLRSQSAAKPKFAFKRKAGPPVAASAATAISRTAPNAQEAVSAQTAPSSDLSLHDCSSKYLSLSTTTLSKRSELVVTIEKLDRCIVNLLPVPSSTVDDASITFSAVHISNVSNSILILPALKGSIIVHNMTRCVLAVGCHQFRMHSSFDVDVYLSIPSTPIIEHSNRLRFASYLTSLGTPTDDIQSRHLAVQDFSHVRATPSPHWSVLPEENLLGDGVWRDLILDELGWQDKLERLLPATISP